MQQQIQQKQESDNQTAEQAKQLELQNQEMAIKTSQANIGLIKAEVDNKKIDNKRQLLSAEDESNRKWAEIAVKAMGTEGATIPSQVPVDFQSLYQDTEQEENEAAEVQAQGEQLAQAAMQNPEQAMQMAGEAGIDMDAVQGMMNNQ